MPRADEKYRAPLLWLLGPYVAGLVIAAASGGGANPLVVVVAVLLGVAAMAVSFRWPQRSQVYWSLLLAAAAGLGGLVHMQFALDPGGATVRWRGLPSREASLEVALTRLFARAEGETRQLCLGRIVTAPSPLQDLAGQRVCFAVDAATAPEQALIRSSHLQLGGVLRRLDHIDPAGDGFEEYLVRSGVDFMLERAGVEAQVRAPHGAARFLHHVSIRFETILRQGLPEGHPAAAGYVAMFLGRKSELSATQKESYLRSGTMHLFAISGLHIAMIAYCLQGVLLVARLRPEVVAALGLVALLIFVEATGGTPSARRAFLMVGFIWAGSALRRPANPLAALVASALLVLLWDPLALLSASFQLSYAVVAALLLYGLPLRNRWQAWWQPWRDVPVPEWRWWQTETHQWGRNTCTVLAISCSATLVSTPLSLDYFQLAAPGAILSNVVLMPIAIGAIAAGFASLVCGLCGATMLSTVFNHAGALILAVVDRGAQWSAQVPGMYFAGRFAHSWMAPAIVALLLAVLAAGYARGWRRFPGRWWTPPAVLVILLVFLVTPGGKGQESLPMKSAYELAMERLHQSDPTKGPELTAEQKDRLAEIDRVFKGRIAEREIFLQQRLAEVQAAGQFDELEKIRQQITAERARLAEEREDAKNQVRREKR